MRKFLIIIFLSLLLTGGAYAKLSKTAWMDVYRGCYENSDKSKFFQQYCTCFVDGFDAKFSDTELDNFLLTTPDVTKEPLFIKITRRCYDKYK